jgi:hypothetical protein
VFQKRRNKSTSSSNNYDYVNWNYFYHRIEDMTFIDSFYFSFVTLATIGYGDITPVTTIGKVVYGILGLGLVSLSVGVIARELIQFRVKNNSSSED